MNTRKIVTKAISLFTVCLLTCNLAQPAYAKNERPKKVRKPGTGMMVTGIVFTPIMSLATLIAIGSYNSAKNYNCDWGMSHEDGTTEGNRWRRSRENCYKERKEQMASMSTVGGVALVGLGLSITGIIVGAGMRSNSSTEPQVNVHYNKTGHKDLNLTFNIPIH